MASAADNTLIAAVAAAAGARQVAYASAFATWAFGTGAALTTYVAALATADSTYAAAIAAAKVTASNTGNFGAQPVYPNGWATVSTPI